MPRMQRSTWFRIAAILAAVCAVAHSAGMPWTPLTSPNEQAVVDAMKDVRFAVFGVSRSYWDFHQGFGLAVSALLFVQVALLWQSAALARAGGGAADSGGGDCLLPDRRADRAAARWQAGFMSAAGTRTLAG